MNLRRRIFATTLLVSALLVVVVGFVLTDNVTDEVRAGLEARLATSARMVAAALSRDDAPADPAALDELIDELARAADARITIVAAEGRVLADSEFDGPALAALEDHGARPEVVAARTGGESESIRYSRSIGRSLLYRGRRIDAGPWAGSVARIAVPETRVRAAQGRLRREVLVALVAAFAVSAAAAAFLAGHLSRPIRELERVANRVMAGDVSARARVDTGDELEELAQVLNDATRQLSDRAAEATAERDQLEGVLEGMVEGVMVAGADGRIALANTALYAIFGIDRVAPGRTVMEAVRNADVDQAMREAAGTSAPVNREIAISYPALKVLSLHAVGLPGGGGVGVFHDITALKRVDSVRRDFVANVSHELQTPLTAIAGYAEALSEAAGDPDEAREAAHVIARHAQRLSALVSDLLELSRLEAEGFGPARKEVPAAELIAELEAEWRPRAVARGHVWTTRVEPGLVVAGDPRLLRQALANLLENAIQYCPPGSTLRLEATSDDGVAVLEVVDDGPGIPYADQPRLFERFYRVDKGRSRGSGGTGLGLAIVKHVAEVHGGTVEVDSMPGAGAMFRLRIPG